MDDMEEDVGKVKKKKIKPGSFQGLGLSSPTYKAIMRSLVFCFCFFKADDGDISGP